MLTVSPVSAASWRQTGRASCTRSSRAVVAPASRSTPDAEAVLPRSLGLLDEPVRLERGDQPERRALVDAELAGDLGDPGLADPGQHLQDGQRPVDGLDRRRGRLGVADRRSCAHRTPARQPLVASDTGICNVSGHGLGLDVARSRRLHDGA